MPTADAVGKVYAAQWQVKYRQDNIWPSLMLDMSPELIYGDRLALPSDATAYAVGSNINANVLSTNASDHQWGTPIVVTADSVDLVVDKAYPINSLVGKYIEKRVRPSFLTSAANLSASVLREQFNNDLRGTFEAAAAGQQLSPIAVTSANWGNAAHKKAIYDAVREAELAFDYGFLPRGSGRYCVGSPAVMQLLVDYVIEQKLTFQGATNDEALREGLLGRLRGFALYADNSLKSGTSASDDANHTMFFGLRNEGIAFAQEMRGLRVFESEVYRGWLVQGDVSFGSIINQPSKLRIAKHNIT